MKKLFCILTLLLGMIPFAQAQVYFGAGSTRPINPEAAARDLDRQAQPRGKVHRTLVSCRDGSRHIARVCKRHGGVARN